VKFLEEFCSSTATANEFWGTEIFVLTPCWDEEVSLEPSPSVSIAVSIDLTTISIVVPTSDDEEGVVLSRG
jgi:hypothetical protein